MRIGEVARKAGITTATIRYYEQIGVMPDPARGTSGYRSYDDSAVDRLRFVRDAQQVGLSLAEIDMILEMRDAGESTCEHVVWMLESHLDKLDGQIAEMQRTRHRLAAITSRAKKLNPQQCTDPNRCQTIASPEERAEIGASS